MDYLAFERHFMSSMYRNFGHAKLNYGQKQAQTLDYYTRFGEKHTNDVLFKLLEDLKGKFEWMPKISQCEEILRSYQPKQTAQAWSNNEASLPEKETAEEIADKKAGWAEMMKTIRGE